MPLCTSLKSLILTLALLLSAAAPLAIVSTCSAQVAAASGATVRGTIADPDQAVIPGATVTLTPAAGKAVTTTSQPDGSYVARDVPAGTYAVTVTMSGFASFVKQGVHVNPGQSLILNATLAIQAQSQEVSVTAQGAQVSVDQDSNASSTVIKDKDLQALSDDPDELNSELTALAGPAAGPNGGQIYVDGFTGGQLPPKSSIREIRINQNPFSAQYDKLGYGRVEIFTKPGTDKFHGNFNLQGNNKSFNTSNPFLGAANSQPPYHTVFFFGGLNGPLTSFSSFTLNGSYRDIQNNAIVNPAGFYATSAGSTTLCQPGQAGCSSVAYPTTARGISNPQTRYDINPRIDLALGEKNTLVVRYQYESSTAQNRGIGNLTLPSAGYNTTQAENTIQISDTQLISSRIVNETRFEYQHEAASQTALSTDPSISIQGVLNGGGASTQSSTTRENHIEVQNYTSFALAKNFIRFGGRLRTTDEDFSSNSGQNGQFTYSYLLDPCTDPAVTAKPSTCTAASAALPPCTISGLSSYQCGVPSQYNITAINKLTTSGRLTDLGLYAEDDWKPRSNLTISYGIRFETQNVIHSSHDFAPRVSFAYGVPRKAGASTTVVRGGFGIFYDRFDLADFITTQQQNGFNQVQSIFRNVTGACTPTNPAGCRAGTASGRTTIYSLGANTRSSYTMQSAIGLDQQIGRATSISVNYLDARGVHQYLSRDFPGATAYSYQFQSGGVYRESQLLANLNTRMRNLTLFGFYSLNFANANTGGSDTFATNPYNSAVDYGRASFANRNFGVLGGSYSAPYLINISPFLIARSGTPYTVTSGIDLNGDSLFNDRPAYANGSSANCFNASDFVVTPVAGQTIVPVNSCIGPANVSFNLRVSKTIGFGPRTEAARNQGGPGGQSGGNFGRPGRGGGRGPGGVSSGKRYNLTLGAQARNLFNSVPYGTPVSSVSSLRFGKFTSLQGGPFSSSNAVRQITLQAAFSF